ncbi:DUF3089 domain-containing protein [Novosphingobium sp. MBES04]|uniref:DUF3089 domain-containing protein n=1 Tax=Novosphingobium sp. MBES04 TaxID=1206458 RepID=UPI000693AF6E|nr:DUF3089 domain-containing protein [Novosphingobium sp. MBES04]GAM06689.1 hypothetical conserved protein [Novosphingobium sp. MBES04]
MGRTGPIHTGWLTRAALGTALACVSPSVLAQGVGPVPTPAQLEEGAREVREGAVTPPDYADPAMWSAGPEGPGTAGALPQGATPDTADPGVAVFYVHPTTFLSQEDDWTQDPADAEANRWADESVVQRQASAFSACCEIWSPRYRAASANALRSRPHTDAAYALAYTDVERAFDWFLEHIGEGRPFILVGHSQGGKHVGDLLEKKVAGTPLQERLVGAYIVGINIAEAEVPLRFGSVPVCDHADQTGCLVQWNAILAGTKLDPIVSAYEKSFTDIYGAQPGQQMVCVNPVTFERSQPSSLSAQAKGAVPGSPGFGPMKPLREGAVAARCERGMLVVYPAPGLGLEPLPGTGVMHYHDIGLFWADIRANARLRAQRWLATHR